VSCDKCKDKRKRRQLRYKLSTLDSKTIINSRTSDDSNNDTNLENNTNDEMSLNDEKNDYDSSIKRLINRLKNY
jgi:CRISPR/Cas system-associated endonuclease/helicase Cas3